MLLPNLNCEASFRHSASGSPGAAFRSHSRRKGTALLAFALATTLAIALAATGAALHADGPGQAAVPNTEPYPPAGGIQPILDLAASALLPGYAFAQVSDSTPPTFVSSTLNNVTGVLEITFSEDIDATPAANVVPAKIHVRESGDYTGGVTLSAGELDTTVDGTVISFTLTAQHLAAVKELNVPELTIEPGAVKDTSGDLIVGTFDISTAAFVDAFSVQSQEPRPTGMTFSSDGTKMFVVGINGTGINEYALATAFDVSTATFASPPFDVSSQETHPTGMAFSSDGTKMFVVGTSGGDVNEYALSEAFDLSTATSSNSSFDVSPQEREPTGVAFSNDGAKMFVVGLIGANVTEYDLATAFGVSTATSSNSSFSVSSQDLSPTGVAFSSDGAKMFVVGSYGDNINEYALSSVYPLMVTGTTNRAPAAEAGPDLPVDEGGTIALRGSGSDIDGDDLTYSWSSDSRLTFDNAASPTPRVTTSSVTANTDITLTLTVSDGTLSGEDTMVLTIRDTAPDNIRPTVNVGPSQTVREGAAVSIPWTADDPDGDDLAYSWSQDPDTPVISFASQDLSPTTFTAPQVDGDTEFTPTMTVTAGPHTVKDQLTVTVRNNHPPTVDAGQDRAVNEGVPVTLSGSASDPDQGDSLTYEWTVASRAGPGMEVALTGSDTARPQFTAPRVTSDEDIVFRLDVTDDAGLSAGDAVTITVRDVPISASSAAYNPGRGTLTVTFNQEIGGAPDYSGLHVRSAGSDAGGIALSDAAPKYSGRTITATLDSAQQDRYGALQSPQLDIDMDAVTDADNIGIEETLDIPIRTASSGKRSPTLPPAIDLNALASRGVDIPPHIADLASSRDKSDPIRPMAPDGTFDFPLVIDGNGYALHSHASTVIPTNVTAGQPVTIKVTMHDATPIAYFAICLNLQGDSISHLQSDTQVVWDSGEVRVTDPNGLMRDASITMSTDPDDPAKKTATITVTFSEGMGDTNMVIRAWNVAGQLTEVQIFDALAVAPPEPEPVIMDPEPGAEQDAVDPEPGTVPDAADSGPAADSSDDRALLAIRMWSGFEPESITDAQLLALLGLDYPGVNIPNWVMAELGPLAAKERITVDQFVLALTYTLENL